jgi:ketosteroid isomerase-like protein
MKIRDVIERYYEYANAGAWDRWCDLFAPDMRMDEQLAGRVEGRDKLREMMSGFPAMYSSFRNTWRYLLVDGDQAAVVSHISAATPDGRSIEADVMNYFQVRRSHITYMANFHDTAPFRGVGQ